MKLSDLDLDLRLPKPPMVLVAVLVIGAFVPMGIASAIWFKRNYFDPHPRIHIFLDMDNQAKGKAQSSSDLFKNGQTMQAYAPGTVAWGRTVHQPDPTMLKDDDLAYRGFEISPETGETVVVDAGEGATTFKYIDGYPDIVTVDLAFVERGRQQYMIHCYTCHGADGRGNGPAKQDMDRLGAISETGTVPLIPANFTDPKFAQPTYPNGKVFYTITRGQGTMNALGPMIPVKDRWAIVAYLRALQKAQAVESAAQ